MKRTGTLNLPIYEDTDKYYINDVNITNEAIDTSFSELQETFNTIGNTGATTTQEVILARGGKDNLNIRLDGVDEQLSDIVTLNAKLLGAKGNANYKKADGTWWEDSSYTIPAFDNTPIWTNAINLLKARYSGGILFIPIGNYLGNFPTFEGCKHNTIKGEDVYSNLETNVTQLIIKDTCSVGIQLSDNIGEVPTWSSIGVTLKNLVINANGKAMDGVNGNYLSTFENVTVREAIQDGFVLEAQTYPVRVYNCRGYSNGRHGLYVKAPYTTIYQVEKSNFAFNGSYGICIEDGNTSTFKDVQVQNNTCGGLKIILLDSAQFTNPIFLQRLTFEGFYTEANGKLAIDDPNYEGNCAIKIVGLSTNSLYAGKINNLLFINSAINIPTNAKRWDVQGVNGLTLINTTPLDMKEQLYPASILGYNELTNSNMYLPLNTGVANDYFSRLSKSMKEVVLNISKDSTDGVVKVSNGGYLGYRGRTRELMFYAPTITAGQSVLLNTVFPTSEGINGYMMLQKSTLIKSAVRIMKGITAGTLTFNIKYGTAKYTTAIATTLPTTETIVLSSTDTDLYKTVEYPLFKYSLDANYIIGIEMVASADYVGISGIKPIFHLFLES